MSVLFARLHLWPGDFSPRSFIPDNVRPHVRTIEFADLNGYVPAEHSAYYRTMDHLRVRDTSETKFLLDAFRGMTRLRNLVIYNTLGNGLPFYILDAIFSAPQLCSVECGPSMCLPTEKDPSFPRRPRLTGPVPPITTFRRVLSTHQRSLREPAEATFLACLFNHIHTTLQVAEMPSDTAPLGALRSHDWPRLHELILRGGPRRSSCAHVIENLTRMPNLRVLKLELAQRSGAGLQRICPPGWTGGCPWPKLEVLTISNPHPDDDLYDHLPDSLQELTIRCFPRYYLATAPDEEGAFIAHFGWESSLPTSANMLHILRRCGPSLRHLRHLDIEFEESGEDVQLLRHISSTFPMLAFLQFLRYHQNPQHGTPTSWVDFGEALSLLSHLRLLRVHLDLERMGSKESTSEVISALASPLSQTVRFVCLLVRSWDSHDWHAWRVARDPGTGKLIAVEDLARYYAQIDGYPYAILSF
ncbi:uncharacterized protein TRAVEDRAFT_49042 [Trametes versicolor FP-101664 SS1]|uniref:uncharacterized protein n=1 Tax=Trametes versicolor (strain FP-101664) TaxID=717944 RepID=UPI00046223E9|nr:uncharacterized protein TRAVEDRAFT_49042 [Trametes versicolor FP-101664 SS1]EIW58028.1 hypothetical protein TRAVEDRAFT_49042 [Trametes versicolor FP-101664 SS1]